MAPELLAGRVKTLELQLAVLKARLARLTPAPPGSPRTFGDLCGILAGQGPVNEEDFEAAKYRFEWDGRLEG